MNLVFFVVIVISVLTAAFTGTMPKLTAATVSSAREAVELAIGLLGQMALWLGLVNVLREAGLMRALARVIEPVMRRLFPDVPARHPAMSAMVLNLAANFLLLSPIGVPPEALPLALLRPLSGNGSLVVLGDGLEAYGPDSFLGYFLSVLNGSTQTTFYVVALYFGAVQIKAMRHTLAACLIGSFAAMAGALVICTLRFAQK